MLVDVDLYLTNTFRFSFSRLLPEALFSTFLSRKLFSYLLLLMSFQMKLILVLSVVFLVSADARPRGSWLGKITRSFQGLMSAGKEMACKYQLPFSTKLLSCDSSEPRFCGDYDCPNFYEKKLNVSSKDYTLRCYPKPYKWVSTTFNGNYDILF